MQLITKSLLIGIVATSAVGHLARLSTARNFLMFVKTKPLGNSNSRARRVEGPTAPENQAAANQWGCGRLASSSNVRINHDLLLLSCSGSWTVIKRITYEK